MHRSITAALTALAALTCTVPIASATETVWPPGGGGTAWTGFATTPAVTPDGGLAVVRTDSGGNDNLVRLAASGLVASTGPNLAAGWSRGGMSADSAGNVYMSEERDPVASRVVRISPDNTATTLWQQSPTNRYIQDPILIDGRGRVVFAAVDESGASDVTKIVRVNTDGTAQEFHPETPNEATELAVDQSGNAFVAIWGNGPAPARVMKISVDGVMTQLATLPNSFPTMIAAGPSGMVHVGYDNGTLGTVSPQGVVSAVPGVTLCGPPWEGIVNAAKSLYVTAQCGGANAWVYAISPDGTPEEVKTFSGEYPKGTVLDGRGNLSVALATPSGASRIVRLASGGATPEIGPAPPAVPPAPTATPGDRSATVSVSSPANAQFGTPTSYEVSSVEAPSKTCTIAAPATSCTVTGLDAGTRYTFVARAHLLAWVTPASAASAAVTPTATTTPGGTPASITPAALRSRTRCANGSCVTTGRLPAGATRVAQSAASVTGSNALFEALARKTVTGRCTLSPAKVKGKKVKTRTYTCRIRLGAGKWRVTTDALRGSTTIARSTRTVVVPKKPAAKRVAG